MSESLWSVDQVAEFLNVPKWTVYAWASRAQGPRSYRIGRYRRYRPEDVRAWLDRQAGRDGAGAA